MKVDGLGAHEDDGVTLLAKARFHRFIKDHAVRDDLDGVVEVLKAIRFYLGIKAPGLVRS